MVVEDECPARVVGSEWLLSGLRDGELAEGMWKGSPSYRSKLDCLLNSLLHFLHFRPRISLEHRFFFSCLLLK